MKSFRFSFFFLCCRFDNSAVYTIYTLSMLFHVYVASVSLRQCNRVCRVLMCRSCVMCCVHAAANMRPDALWLHIISKLLNKSYNLNVTCTNIARSHTLHDSFASPENTDRCRWWRWRVCKNKQTSTHSALNIYGLLFLILCLLELVVALILFRCIFFCRFFFILFCILMPPIWQYSIVGKTVPRCWKMRWQENSHIRLGCTTLSRQSPGARRSGVILVCVKSRYKMLHTFEKHSDATDRAEWQLKREKERKR